MGNKKQTQLNNIPANDKFLGTMKQILAVSKEELKRREGEWKKTRGKTRRKRKTG